VPMVPDPMVRGHGRRRAGAVALALALAALAGVRPARADGEGGDAESLEKQLRAQMEKIVRLMKENEKAILEASKGAPRTPVHVDVDKPEAPAKPTPPPEKQKPGEPGGDASGEKPTPGGRGEEVRRRMEELLRATQEGGGSIP